MAMSQHPNAARTSDALDTPARPNLRHQQKAETRQRIVESSQQLFTSKGYRSTTVDQIADSSGISRQTFYSHFSDKSDVLATIIENYLPRASALFARLPGPFPTLEQAQDWMKEWNRFAYRERSALLTLMETDAGSPEGVPDIHAIPERLFEELAERLPAFAAARRDDDVGLRARARAQTVMYAITWSARISRRTEQDRFREALMQDAAELLHDFTNAPQFIGERTD